MGRIAALGKRNESQMDLTEPRAATKRRKTWMLALAFVLACLAVLVATPLLVQNRVASLRWEISADLDPGLAPARVLVTRVRFALSQERTITLALVTTRDFSLMSALSELRTNERDALQRLQPIVDRMGPRINRHTQALNAGIVSLHERVDRRLAEDSSGSIEARQQLAREFSDIARLSDGLDRAVAAETARDRQAIRGPERSGAAFSAGLSLVALAVAVVVAWLVARVDRFADQAEDALAEAKNVAEQKAALLRGLSHDVKNPLGAADGYASLLEYGIGGKLNVEQIRLVEGIRRSIRRSVAGVADLIALQMRETADLTFHNTEVDLVTLVRTAGEEYRATAEAAGHSLAFTLPEGAIPVCIDEVRVQQILDNLISNAIKYAPAPGLITIGVEAVRSTSEAGASMHRQRVWVADNGPGIRPEHREAVFDEFRRLEPSGVAGHGLGLAISRRLARYMGGDLTLSPAATGGSVFTLELPGSTAECSPGEVG